MENKNKTNITFSIKKLSYILIIGVILTILSFILDKSVLKLTSRIQQSFFISFFSAITFLGELKIFLGVLIIITIIFFIFRKKIFGLWLSAISAFILELIIKTIVARPRPFEFLNISSVVNTTTSSFPSGHTIAFFCILPFLNDSFPKGKIFFWILAILVGLSRIYLEVHYVSDVVAGAFIGYIVGSIFLYLGKKYSWS